MRTSYLLLLLLLFSLSVTTSTATAAAKPNVIIILADDLGYSDVGCYGGEIKTPNLNALAKDGLRFTQFYNTARCWPTRSALMLGYYAQQIRRDSLPGLKRGAVPGWAKSIPTLLKTAGYRSYHSGKWHIDKSPLGRGFEKSYWTPDHDRFFSPKRHRKDDENLPPVERGTDYYTTNAVTDHAIECLQQHEATTPEKPFFQYVAYICPHFPLHALQEDIDKYKKVYTAGWDVIRDERWQRIQKLGLLTAGNKLSQVERDLNPPYAFPDAIKKLGPGEINTTPPWNELTAKQKKFQADKMAIHAAMVDRMDQNIGRLVAQLKKMKQFENTLIFFLADNGASAEIMVRGDGHDPDAAPGSANSYLCLGPGWASVANTPFRRHKTWVHEGGCSTPLIVSWPKGIEKKEWGGLRRTPGHVVDLLPTVLDAAGILADRPKKYEGKPVPTPPGKSLLPVFNENKTIERDFLWWCHDGNRAIRVGDWKLVSAKKQATGDWELYDLSKDRGESKNLAAKNPEIVAKLSKMWEAECEKFIRDLKK